MLDEHTQLDIAQAAQDRWAERCEAGEMAAYMQRKERGRGLADFVEDVTVKMLERRYPGRAAFQGSGAERRRRSMGDIWIESNGVFNPINIKGRNGGVRRLGPDRAGRSRT